MRIAPPPPGVLADRWSVPGEVEMLQKWEPRIQLNARRVPNAHRLGMSTEGVEQEMRMMVVIAIRRFAAERGKLPPPQFLTTVIKRRAQHFNRATRVWWRLLDDMVRQSWDDDDDQTPVIDRVQAPAGDLPDTAMTAAEQQDTYQALVYVLQQNLPPAAFAILHLRIIEEMSPVEIAEITGIQSNTHASKRVGYAKAIAWGMLRSLGIEDWEDVLAVTPQEISHE